MFLIKRPLRRMALALAMATGFGAAYDASAQGTNGTITNPAQQPNSLNPDLNPNLNLDPNSTPNVSTASDTYLAHMDAETYPYAVCQLPHPYAAPNPPAPTYKDILPTITCSHRRTIEPVEISSIR